jgi:hypothetical protein
LANGLKITPRQTIGPHVLFMRPARKGNVFPLTKMEH